MMYAIFSFTANQDFDWNILNKNATLDFTTFNTQVTRSNQSIIVSIHDDLVTEDVESLICSLQVGIVQSVRTGDPKQVTIVIVDNEGNEVECMETSELLQLRIQNVYMYIYVIIEVTNSIQ